MIINNFKAANDFLKQQLIYIERVENTKNFTTFIVKLQ